MRHVRTLTGLAAAVGIIGFGYNQLAQSADHIDSAAVTTDPTADINDVYTWIEGNNVVLVMDVIPIATTTSKFSDAIKYVFHTESSASFGVAGTKLDIICTFNAAQKAQCWAGANTYVTGDASVTAGLASMDGKFKVFAGLRADPFFFNLDGFKHTVATVKSAAANLQFDPAGCPTLDAATSQVLVNQLKTDAAGGAPKDFFATFNTMSIVVSVDKSLLNAGGPILSVSAGTYK